MTKRKKNNYIKMAKDFLYSDEVIQKLENASSEEECSNIMCNARKQRIKEEYM